MRYANKKIIPIKKGYWKYVFITVRGGLPATVQVLQHRRGLNNEIQKIISEFSYRSCRSAATGNSQIMQKKITTINISNKGCLSQVKSLILILVQFILIPSVGYFGIPLSWAVQHIWVN